MCVPFIRFIFTKSFKPSADICPLFFWGGELQICPFYYLFIDFFIFFFLGGGGGGGGVGGFGGPSSASLHVLHPIHRSGGGSASQALEVEVTVEAAWPRAALGAELLEGLAQLDRGESRRKCADGLCFCLLLSSSSFSGRVTVTRVFSEN